MSPGVYWCTDQWLQCDTAKRKEGQWEGGMKGARPINGGTRTWGLSGLISVEAGGIECVRWQLAFCGAVV